MSGAKAPVAGGQAPAQAVSRRRRPRRVAWAPWVALLLFLLVVAALVGLLFSAPAAADLFAARSSSREAVAALGRGNLDGAREALSQARAEFERADAQLRSPLARPAFYTPVLGRNVRVAAALAASGAEASAGAGELVGAVAELPQGLASLSPRNGRVPLDAVGRLARPARLASARLDRAERLLAGSPERGLLGPVAQARQDYGEQLAAAARTGRVTAALTAALPGFLGQDEPRRYFVGAQNPAELRGTGGYVGAYSILRADDGRLEFGPFRPTPGLRNVHPNRLPEPVPGYRERYNRYGGAGHWTNANITPDFPTAATVIENLWAHTRGEQLDGVVFVDPTALQALLELTGPTSVPRVGTVTADTVVPFVTNEAFAQFDDSALRKRLLGEVAKAAMESFLGGSRGRSPQATLTALAEAASDGHLLVHALDDQAQEAFQVAGVDGALDDTRGDYLGVFGTNAASNKADFYARRRIDYEVRLDPGGAAVSRASVTLRNDAPRRGVPRHVTGPNRPFLDPGDNLTVVSVYCATTCTPTGFQRRLGDRYAITEQERGRPVVTADARVPSGGHERLRFGWTSDRVWDAGDGSGRYHFTYQGQSTLRPTQLRVAVQLPDGARVATLPDGVTREEGLLVWSGVPGVEHAFSVDFTTPPTSWWGRLRRFLQQPLLGLRTH